jgi:dTDP-4-amino-4,6-dideoxygalactose transaminase
MKVDFSYLERQFRQVEAGEDEEDFYTDLILKDVREFIKTGDFTLGRKGEEFEERFAGLVGVRHAIGVSSGTDALILSLRALGVGPGDEVITSAETFIATAGAIAGVGARPVFVDVGDDYQIDAGLVEKVITGDTKAIVPVWFTGNAPDMEKVLEIAGRHDIPIVEDSCCAIDAAIDGKRAGSFGRTGTFSFHPLKNLNVWGDGGMITTDSDDLCRKLRLLRNHGLATRDEVEIFGFNSRLDTLQAVIGLRMIGDVRAITDKRIRHARRLDEAFSRIPDHIEVPPRRAGVRQVFHLYVVRARRRDDLYAWCREKGVDVKIHYPIPLPYQKCCSHLGYRPGDFPKTERDCGSIITFPAHQHLADDEIDYLIETVEAFYRR